MLGAYIFIIAISSSWIDHLIIRQCPSLSLFTVFISKSSLSVKYCYSCFLLIPIYMEYHFPSLDFQSACVLKSQVGLF